MVVGVADFEIFACGCAVCEISVGSLVRLRVTVVESGMTYRDDRQLFRGVLLVVESDGSVHEELERLKNKSNGQNEHQKIQRHPNVRSSFSASF